MSSLGRGRVAVAHTAAALIGIVAFAVLNWGTIATRYHLYKLSRDPDYLREIIGQPESSSRGKAVRAYASSPEGKQRLFDLYADTALKSVFIAHPPKNLLEGVIWIGGDRAGYVYWGAPPNIGASFGIQLVEGADPELLRSIANLMGAFRSERLKTAEYPGFLFEFVSGAEAPRRTPLTKVGIHKSTLPAPERRCRRSS